MNRYVYVGNNPINSTDCFGLKMCKNNSGQDLPYKHEDDDHKEPRICKKGEVCDVDGFYMPDHRVVKIWSYVSYDCEVDEDFDVTGWGKPPCEVSKSDLQLEQFKNWPDPYTGRKWPYPAWP